jgi:hypothetical protein
MIALQQPVLSMIPFLCAQKDFTMLFTGLNGALGLYTSLKGMLDSAKAASESKKIRKKAFAEEDGWFKRNYYENLLGSTASRAAIKRVEETLKRQNQQDRARALVTGATPEYSLAKSGQTLRSLENVLGNIASADSERRNRIDLQHRQNSNALLNNELANLSIDEKMSASSAANGLNLLQNALWGVNWGNEKKGK